MAIVLNNQSLKMSPIIRTMLFIPVVTTTAIVGIVMSFVLAAFNGPVNQVLLGLRLTQSPIDFLGNPDTVMWSVIGISIWKWFGLPMVYWMAGLQTIPGELYEVASLDGAGWWHKMRSITVPLLLPFAAIIGLITLVGNLQVFALIQTLTNGGPYFSSETIELYIYRIAFGATGSTAQQRFGYASAAGVLFGVTIMLIAGIQVLAVRRWRGRGGA